MAGTTPEAPQEAKTMRAQVKSGEAIDVRQYRCRWEKLFPGEELYDLPPQETIRLVDKNKLLCDLDKDDSLCDWLSSVWLHDPTGGCFGFTTPKYELNDDQDFKLLIRW